MLAEKLRNVADISNSIYRIVATTALTYYLLRGSIRLEPRKKFLPKKERHELHKHTKRF